ncbi:MAG TPA: serine/threonine-protein kinase [Pyrinomonadaceae bacterium]|nr:serine/threonine-protein kinase [Pyrinomonadaceae bacterium]
MLAPDTRLKERYRILEKIGGGGFGHVYKAVDEVFGCGVAIKETREEVANLDRLRKAFEREAKLLHSLRHDSLPRVTDYFFHDGAQFLVMDFIEGEDFTSRLRNRLRQKQGPFTCQELLPWADKILAALEYLHSRPEPIIHRDIKPSNIKLTDEGDVYLLDFGLAKGVTGQMSTIIEGQSSSSVLGFTREYAPLEQLQDTGTEPQSDIYALGATLYHLLTAQLPVSAPLRDEALQKGQSDPLRTASDVNPAISPAVSQVISQAMAVRWWDRFGSAREMRDALARSCEEVAAELPRSAARLTLQPVLANAQEDRSTLKRVPLYEPSAGNGTEAVSSPDKELARPSRLRRSWFVIGITLVLLAGLAVVVRLAFPSWFTPAVSNKPEATVMSPENLKTPLIATPADLKLRRRLQNHEGVVWSVALSPDGTLAASGSEDKTIILWDAKTWGIRFTLRGHTGAVYSVAFSPDGKTLASGSYDETIRLWDTQTGKPIEPPLSEHTKPVIRLAFSPDGDFLASVGSEPKNGDKEIRLWDVRGGWKSKILEGHHNAVLALAFSPDRRTLVSASYDNTLRLWDVRGNGQSMVLKPSGPDQTCAAVAFSADGKYLACGSSDKTVKLWLHLPEPQGWAEIAPLKAHAQPIISIAFSPDNKTLVSAGEDNTLRLWDITAQTSKLLTTSQGRAQALLRSVAFSPDGQTLLTGGEDKTVSVWQ